MTKTSCSDNGTYPDFCLKASSQENIFNCFRRHPVYTQVVETVPRKGGKDYLKLALKFNPKITKHLDKFATSERIGSPKTYKYRTSFLGKNYTFSPTTLRYVLVLSQLVHFFGDLNNFNIVEIGVGYGGLCKVIADLFPSAKYTLVDLPEALSLSQKFLTHFDVKNVQYLDATHIPTQISYDLCISNYAFSELSRDIQDLYFQNILKNSKCGYMLCNFKTHTWQNEQYKETELLELLKGSVVYKDKQWLANIELQYNISLITWNQ